MVPARGFTLPCPDALAAYRRLRETNPLPFFKFVMIVRSLPISQPPSRAHTTTGSPVKGCIEYAFWQNVPVNLYLELKLILSL